MIRFCLRSPRRHAFRHFATSSRDIPTLRDALTRSAPHTPFVEAVQPPSSRPYVLYAFGLSTLAFAVAAEHTNYDTDAWTAFLTVPKSAGVLDSLWAKTPSTGDMRLARTSIWHKKLQAFVGTLQQKLASAPRAVQSVVLHSYKRIAEDWLKANDGRRAAYCIGALNTAVYLMWKAPRLRAFMHTHFTHDPLSGRRYTLVTSMFSHASVFHLAFNMMALASFSSSTTAWMVSEQQRAPSHLEEANPAYHFLAFYLSAGLASGLVSHLVSTRILYPRLVRQLTTPSAPIIVSPTPSRLLSNARAPAADASRAFLAASTTTTTTTATTAAAAATKTVKATPILPSLGASGAIYACVLTTALAFPNAQVALIFPPTPEFPIAFGVGGIVALDMLGVLRGWRLFDHYAHLGGAAFGAVYYLYGATWWDAWRKGLRVGEETEK